MQAALEAREIFRLQPSSSSSSSLFFFLGGGGGGGGGGACTNAYRRRIHHSKQADSYTYSTFNSVAGLCYKKHSFGG